MLRRRASFGKVMAALHAFDAAIKRVGDMPIADLPTEERAELVRLARVALVSSRSWRAGAELRLRRTKRSEVGQSVRVAIDEAGVNISRVDGQIRALAAFIDAFEAEAKEA